MRKPANWVLRAVPIAAVLATGCGGDDEEGGVSAARITAAIDSSCTNQIKCGTKNYASVSGCVRDRNTRFHTFYDNQSKACRAAVLDSYECWGTVSCDQYDVGCEQQEEVQDDLCPR